MRLGLGLALSGGGLPAFYPDATLALDFVAGAYRVGAGGFSTPNFAPLPGLTVSRASVGYAERQDGTLVLFGNNVARITDKGLLVEESRTNLLLRSQDFANATWTKSNVSVTANTANAPDGTQTASLIKPTGTNAQFQEVQQNFSTTVGQNYTFSAYVKNGGYPYVMVLGTSTEIGTVAWIIDTGAGTETSFTAGTSTVVARSITPSVNGWYRISLTVTALATGTSTARFAAETVPASNSARGVTFTGDGVNGMLTWGWQIENAAFPTSYIPTTSASATRAADSVSVAAAGVGLPDTLFAEVATDGTARNTNRPIFAQGGSRGAIYLNASGTNRFENVIDGVAALSSFANSAGTHKMAARFAASDQAFAGDGSLAGTTSNATADGASRAVYIGGNTTGIQFFNEYIRRIVLYPTGYGNTALTGITQ